MVIGGRPGAPVLMPAVAIGQTADGQVALEVPVDRGDGPVNVVPIDACREYDEDLQLRVNRLTATAMDALDNANVLVTVQSEPAFLTVEQQVQQVMQRARPIGFC
jgi:hypothetical protein